MTVISYPGEIQIVSFHRQVLYIRIGISQEGEEMALLSWMKGTNLEIAADGTGLQEGQR